MTLFHKHNNGSLVANTATMVGTGVNLGFRQTSTDRNLHWFVRRTECI
jgi:hypothetical protein